MASGVSIRASRPEVRAGREPSAIGRSSTDKVSGAMALKPPDGYLT